MIQFFDYTSRRGALVPLLPLVYARLKPREHIITWTQQRRTELLDINRRFLVAMNGKNLVGLMFYRYEGTDLYLEDCVAESADILEGLIKKLEFDKATGAAVFFFSDRIKLEKNQEILASVGFAPPKGYVRIGSLNEAKDALRIRGV